MKHGKWHWACCWRPVLGHVFLAAAVISFVFVWVSIYKANAIQNAAANNLQSPYLNPLVFGLEPLAWYWNALVLGVLSMAVRKGSDHCHSCELEEGSSQE